MFHRVKNYASPIKVSSFCFDLLNNGEVFDLRKLSDVATPITLMILFYSHKNCAIDCLEIYFVFFFIRSCHAKPLSKNEQ